MNVYAGVLRRGLIFAELCGGLKGFVEEKLDVLAEALSKFALAVPLNEVEDTTLMQICGVRKNYSPVIFFWRSRFCDKIHG